MASQIVTANRLRDGAVVYLTTDGQWSERVADGGVVEDDSAAESLMATAQASVDRRHVVEPYLIDVSRESDGLRPLRYREAIRAFGPSTHPEFGRPAAEMTRNVLAP